MSSEIIIKSSLDIVKHNEACCKIKHNGKKYLTISYGEIMYADISELGNTTKYSVINVCPDCQMSINNKLITQKVFDDLMFKLTNGLSYIDLYDKFYYMDKIDIQLHSKNPDWFLIAHYSLKLSLINLQNESLINDNE